MRALLLYTRATSALPSPSRGGRLAQFSWRSLRAKHAAPTHSNICAQTKESEVIFEALPGKAVRMLKFMSLAGTAMACTATAVAALTQAQGQLGESDLGAVSLALASSVSIASTVAVTKMFGPFVTRVTLIPRTASTKGIRLDRHGLPKFDSILSSAATAGLSSGPGSAAVRPMLSGRIAHDTEIVLQSPGLLGFNSHYTRVMIGDLESSSRRFRTWELTADALDQRKRQG
ncbi:hypothetical protein GGH92_010371, partial [Coemansia sp. RSA 2673]